MDLKYEYHLFTWGGFYNEEYFKIHKKPRGDFWFDSSEKRQEFINELRDIENKLNAYSLAMTLSEGYCCRTRTIVHRVFEYNGKTYYQTYDLGINYEFAPAKYFIEYKWGFEDEKNQEINDNEVKVIKSWITGADQDVEQ
jgi:hypothetical protein